MLPRRTPFHSIGDIRTRRNLAINKHTLLPRGKKTYDPLCNKGRELFGNTKRLDTPMQQLVEGLSEVNRKKTNGAEGRIKEIRSIM